jgi:hypothetical protein
MMVRLWQEWPEPLASLPQAAADLRLLRRFEAVGITADQERHDPDNLFRICQNIRPRG